MEEDPAIASAIAESLKTHKLYENDPNRAQTMPYQSIHGDVTTYSDYSITVNCSIIVNPDRTVRVNGAMCSLIAIYESDPTWIGNVTGATSPWGLFKWLNMLGWTFHGHMLERRDLEAIAQLLECTIRVEYVNLTQDANPGQRVILNIRARDAHFLNGSDLY